MEVEIAKRYNGSLAKIVKLQLFSLILRYPCTYSCTDIWLQQQEKNKLQKSETRIAAVQKNTIDKEL